MKRARPWPGSLGTAIVRVFDVVAGMTGWPEKRLAQEGIEFDSTVITDNNHAAYFPGSRLLQRYLLKTTAGIPSSGQYCHRHVSA